MTVRLGVSIEKMRTKKANDGGELTEIPAHQSPSGCRLTTRMRLRIMNRPPAGFSSMTNALRTALYRCGNPYFVANVVTS